MNRIVGLRALRGGRRLLTVGLGICAVSPLMLASPARLDAHGAIGVQPNSLPSREQRSRISPNVVRQISSGSMAGL